MEEVATVAETGSGAAAAHFLHKAKKKDVSGHRGAESRPILDGNAR